MQYWPGAKNRDRGMLPGLPTALYGFDRLKAAGTDKTVLLVEGPFDAVALDYSLGHHRGEYAVAAIPGTFKGAWAEHFRGLKVRAIFDNDEGGRGHAERVGKLLGTPGVADELLCLRWPDGTPEGFDVNDLVKDREGGAVLGWLLKHCHRYVRDPKPAWSHGLGPQGDRAGAD